MPDQSTLNRHLNSFSPHNVGELKAVAEQLLVKANCTREMIDVVLDFDTTVATVYGKQEEAAVGYNPRKKGRRSYCIKVSFLGHNGDAANWRLDSGDTHALNGFQEFYLETVKSLPANYRVRYVRLDKGFAGDGTFRFLEGEKVGYIAAMPARERVRQQAQGIPGRAWHKVSPRLHMAEMEYQCLGWKQPRRFIVKKELVEEKGHHKPIQGSFFPQHRFRVEYSFYVTSIQGHSPVELWSFYNSRANVENRIKEAKLGFNLEHLPSRLKAANDAYISLVFLAHNILNWFKRFLLKGMARLRNIAWIRNFLIQIPAIVEKVGHWWHLRLPRGYRYRSLMAEAHQELARASPIRA